MNPDVVVVGGGLCGVLAAKHIAAAGHSVRVLEGGPGLALPLPPAAAAFRRVVASVTSAPGTEWAYRGPREFEWIRVRAHGGRTLLWGGWMDVVPPDYFQGRRRSGSSWPRELEDLTPWLPHAERLLSVRTRRRGALHRRLAALGHQPLAKREARSPGLRRALTAADLEVPEVLSVECPVLSLERRGTVFRVYGHEEVVARARRVVLAASPVETARILEQSLPPRERRLRVTFSDHLIAGALVLAPRTRSGPPAVMFPEEDARFRFTTEVRGPNALEQLDAEDLANLGVSRSEARTLSFYVVFAMGETDPRQPRVVRFDVGRPDALGRPSPRFIHRPHTRYEHALARAMNASVLSLARSLGSRRRAFLINDAREFAIAGHETGTCLERVDAHGEVSALRGVFVADGAGVPAATDRHPSLLLAANALRVADAVVNSLHR